MIDLLEKKKKRRGRSRNYKKKKENQSNCTYVKHDQKHPLPRLFFFFF